VARPGITGWAQVNGRNALSWKKKFDLDLWYVNNASIMLDLKNFSINFKESVYSGGNLGSWFSYDETLHRHTKIKLVCHTNLLKL
jgi:hypothetical protein